MTQPTAARYDKLSPTFVDAIALVRRHLWLASEDLSLSGECERQVDDPGRVGAGRWRLH